LHRRAVEGHHRGGTLWRWNVDNPNEVWYAADRPYGLIEASILRDDLPAAPEAWLGVKGFI
jgi:urate oxidase